MIKSLIYIRISEQAPTTYAVPLLEQLKQQIPELTTFEFDNFSEESIRQYVVELVRQSERVAVIVVAESAKAPVSGLTTLFNRLLKARPPRLLMALEGEQPLLMKMMETMAGPNFYHNMPEEQLAELLVELFN